MRVDSTKLSQLESNCIKLQSSLADLSRKIDKLSSRDSNFQMQIESASDSLNTPSIQGPTTSDPSSNAALTIVNELADRAKRKRNIIVYNFPEASDRLGDKRSFSALCNATYESTFKISKIMHLGKKIVNKHRPMLICLDPDEDWDLVLSRSYRLKSSEQYKRVYIVPDRTKLDTGS